MKPNWFKKGISIIGNVLTDDCNLLFWEDFQENFDIITIFIEYQGFALIVELYLDNHEEPDFNLTRPANSLIYSILLRDDSEVSNLYKAIHHKNNNIIQTICSYWYEKANIILHSFEVKNSFTITHWQIYDIYLKYTQFRTLHCRYYTNDVLVKCKVLDIDTCSPCLMAKDSNFHMLIDCTFSIELWSQIKIWISSLGLQNYTHIQTDGRNVLSDLENSPPINVIILNTKKYIYCTNQN